MNTFVRKIPSQPEIKPKHQELRDLDKIVENSSEKNRNFFVAYLGLLIYIQAIIFSTTDLKLLYSADGLKMPFIDLTLPLVGFYVIAPLFIIALHFNFLQNLESHHYKLMQWQNAAGGKVLRRSIQPFLFDYAILENEGQMKRWVGCANSLLCYNFAPITLGLLLIRFSDFQYPLVTIWHYLAFIIDVWLVWKLRRGLIDNENLKKSLTKTSFKLFFLDTKRYGLRGVFGLLILFETLLTVCIGWTTDDFFVANIQPLVQPITQLEFKLENWLREKNSSKTSENFNNFIKPWWWPLIKTASLPAEWLLPYIAIDRSETVWVPDVKKIEAAARIAGYKDDWGKYFSEKGQGFIPATKNLRLVSLPFQNLRRATLTEAKLQGANLYQAQLQGAVLESAQLQGAYLMNARLQGAILESAQLQGANLLAAQLERADLASAQLQGTYLMNAQLQGANLYQAQLQGAVLESAQLQGAYLESAQLQGANLASAQLQGANLNQAQLQGAVLLDAELERADLASTQLQGANLMDAQLQGANLMNAQLQGANLLAALLQWANLASAQLQGANLRYAQLQGADLRHAQLQGTNLYMAKLQGANLYMAQLQGANLLAAQLQGAYLESAQLQGANLESAQLQGANLRYAQLQGANLASAQLQGTNLYMAKLQGAFFLNIGIVGIRDPEKASIFYKIDSNGLMFNENVPDWIELEALAQEIPSSNSKDNYLKLIRYAKNNPSVDAKDVWKYNPSAIASEALPLLCKDGLESTQAFRLSYKKATDNYEDQPPYNIWQELNTVLRDIDKKLCEFEDCKVIRESIDGLDCNKNKNQLEHKL